MGGKEKDKKKKTATSRGSTSDKSGGLLRRAVPLLASVAVAAAAYFFGPALWTQYQNVVAEGAQVQLRIEKAGPASDTLRYGVSTNMTKGEYDKLVKRTTLYDGRTGKELLNWPEVVDVASSGSQGGGELPVLAGPARRLPALKHFEWPTVEAGHKVEVADMDRRIVLETINLSPPVFFVHNFLGEGEAEKLIKRATSPDNPYSVRRSTTGHKSWNQHDDTDTYEQAQSSTRTSDNGFDIDSPTAKAVKRRAWKLLRMSGEFDEALTDGLQVLRYQQKQAYIAHNDYFPVDSSTDHNWDPAKGGTNRFATVFIYLSDVEEGGQTVFPKAQSASPSPVPEAAQKLFPKGSWQAKMVEDCYSRFAVKPKKGSAILFYSQKEGKLNPASLHGGCPVLNGTKWAANLWFWNGCRFRECRPHHKSTGIKMPFAL